MSYTASGLSTLGIELGYGSYSNNSTLPSSLTPLGRINAIGGISLSTENIDSSAIVDKVTQYIQGRQDTGGEWTITINLTDETLAEWKSIAGQKKYFEIYHPSMTNSLWVVATVPEQLGVPEVAQNELFTYEISLTLNYYYGWSSDNVIAIDSEGNVSYSVDITQTSASVAVGETTTLTADVEPSGTAVKWSSSNESVAMVSQAGVVIGVSSGTATITATAGTATDSITVTVSTV